MLIQDKENTHNGRMQVKEQVENGEEVLHPGNTSSVLNLVLSTIDYEFEHKCLDKVISLLNAHSICQLTDDHIQGHNYSTTHLPRTMFLLHQVWATLFIVMQ